jgi:hypothetical protein
MSKHVLASSLFPVVDQKQDLFKQKLLFVIGDP